jgi:hypothetical protein
LRAGDRFLIRLEPVGELHADLFQPQQSPDACLILEIRTCRMTAAVDSPAIARTEDLLHGHFWDLIDEDRRVAKAKIRVTAFGSCVCE